MKKVKRRTTLGKEFGKRAALLILLGTGLLTLFFKIQYNEQREQFEAAVQRQESETHLAINDCFRQFLQDRGTNWTSQDLQDFENKLAVLVYRHYVLCIIFQTGYDYPVSDLAMQLYRQNSDGFTMERIKDTEEFTGPTEDSVSAQVLSDTLGNDPYYTVLRLGGASGTCKNRTVLYNVTNLAIRLRSADYGRTDLTGAAAQFLDKYGNLTYYIPVCTTLNLWDIFGRQVRTLYLVLWVILLLVALVWAKLSYNKLALQYAMLDYRKALTDSMAHDIKTPLMAISGYAENLKEQIHTEKKELYAEKILENVDYMNHIVSDVLELSKTAGEQTGVELATLDLREMLTASFHKQETLSEKQVRFKIEGDYKARADEKLMCRCLDNLLGNAVRYCPADSEISVLLDNGIEIRNPAQSPHSDSGLGLSITKELLERQGFTLTTEKKEDEFIAKIAKK